MIPLGSRRGLGVVLALTSWLAVACGTSTDDVPRAEENDLIGGVRSKSSRLDAIGSLRLKLGTPDFEAYCTATLIAPRVVLTAAHCAAGKNEPPYTDYLEVQFALGHDSTKPKRVVKVERTWMPPPSAEGFIRRGADVAALTLAEAIDDVEPLPIADDHIDASVLDARLSVVGFGIRALDGALGERRGGTVTVRATSGPVFGGAFGSLDDLIAYARAEGGEEFSKRDVQNLTTVWEEHLLPHHEAFTGLAPGDAQVCSGDSGGPLLARVDGGLAVFAVTSGVFLLRSTNPCSVLGQVSATFPPDIQVLIDEAASAVGEKPRRVAARDVLGGSAAPAPPRPSELVDVDRCGEESVAGRCDRGAAIRCIGEHEGPKRVTRTDCTLLMQTCTETPDGTECTDEGG